MERSVRNESPGRIRTAFERLGWIGSVFALAGLFFGLGAIVSYLDGDLTVALESTVVVGFLLIGTILLVRKRTG